MSKPSLLKEALPRKGEVQPKTVFDIEIAISEECDVICKDTDFCEPSKTPNCARAKKWVCFEDYQVRAREVLEAFDKCLEEIFQFYGFKTEAYRLVSNLKMVFSQAFSEKEVKEVEK